jgi:hypothetical protein
MATFDFASLKRSARAVVHETMAVQAFYQDDSMIAEVEMRVRFHSKVSKPMGDLYDGSGYANILDGNDRIVFQTPIVDIEGNPVTPVRLAVVRFPTLIDTSRTFSLDMRDPETGPGEEVWTLARNE